MSDKDLNPTYANGLTSRATLSAEFDTESLADTMEFAMRGVAPEWYDPSDFNIKDRDDVEDLAFDVFKNVLDFHYDEKLPSLVQKFYDGRYRDTKNGEQSLSYEIERMIKTKGALRFNELVDEATPIVRERILKRFSTNMKNNHPLKNFFRIENFDNEEIVRIKPNGDMVVPTRNGSKEFPEKTDEKWQHYRRIFREEILIEENLSEIIDNFIIDPIRKKTFPPKYKAQHQAMIKQAERDKKFWIDALAHHMHIEIVREKDKLLPFDDMAVVSHTRRGVTKKKHDGLYDGALYGIYLGEYFLDKILQTPNWKEDLSRYIAQQAKHFGFGDDVIHGDINIPEEYPTLAPLDHEKFIEHDWGFEAYTFSLAMESEIERTEKGKKLTIQEQMALIERIKDLFAKAINKPYINRQTNAEWFCVCYRTLRDYVLAHQKEMPLNTKGEVPIACGVDILPALLEISAQCLSTNMIDRHDLKDPFWLHDIDKKKMVRRDTNGKLRIVTRGDSIDPDTADAQQQKEYAEILAAIKGDDYAALIKNINEALNRNELDVLFEKHERARYENPALKLGKGFFDTYKKERIDMVLTDMNVDVSTDKAYLVEGIEEYNPFIHTRSGTTNPQGYDGATYAVTTGKYFLEVLFMGTTGKQDFQRLLIEESKHFATHRNCKHGLLAQEGDIDRYIDHDEVFLDKCELIGDLADDTLDCLRDFDFDQDTKTLYFAILHELKKFIDTDAFYTLLTERRAGKFKATDKQRFASEFEKVLVSIYKIYEAQLKTKKATKVDYYFKLLRGALLEILHMPYTDDDNQFKIQDAAGRSPEMAARQKGHPDVSYDSFSVSMRAQLGSA